VTWRGIEIRLRVRVPSILFDRCAALAPVAKQVANWMMGDLTRLMNQQGLEDPEARISPENLAFMLRLIADGTISGKIAKKVFEEMFATGKDAGLIIKEQGLVQISDASSIVPVIDQVIADNPKAVEDYRSGKAKAMGSLVGQVMKATKGKANPEMVNKLLVERLEGI
jgi:aspartyl-tRNA(Asn)/glutamyl-tRNA(Gln) amidotransferase subunit B